MLGLGPGNALDIGWRRFAGMRPFIDLRIETQPGAKNDRVERDAHLGQQFTAARATRSEVEAHHPSR